jgi:hypothetical protein
MLSLVIIIICNHMQSLLSLLSLLKSWLCIIVSNLLRTPLQSFRWAYGSFSLQDLISSFWLSVMIMQHTIGRRLNLQHRDCFCPNSAGQVDRVHFALAHSLIEKRGVTNEDTSQHQWKANHATGAPPESRDKLSCTFDIMSL